MATNTAATAARRNEKQMVHYLRKTVNWNDTNIASGVTFPAKLPAGAVITDITIVVRTAFNAATTNNLLIGTTAAGNDIVASADAAAGTVGFKKVVASTIGVKAYFATDSDIYVAYTQSGTAATAGQATIVVMYSVDNDQ